jgi:hypothetical protein
MKLVFLGVGIVGAATALAVSTGFAQAPPTTPIKVLGCLQGDGTEQKPWFISGVALPTPAPAGAPGGGRGAGGGGGGRGGGGGGAAAGAPPAGAGAGAPAGAGAGVPAGAAAPGGAPGGAAGGGGQGGGRGAGGGRGGGGRGGGGAAAPAVPAAPVPLVDLLLAGGMNMSAWRGMKIEVEGTLGPKPASGLQPIRITSARSVQGVCTPK